MIEICEEKEKLAEDTLKGIKKTKVNTKIDKETIGRILGFN